MVTARGESADEKEKAYGRNLVAQLESLNPTESPAQNCAGTWELVWSDTQLFRSSPFFMAGRAVCSTPEQARQYDWFCDMHRAALAISRIQRVRQVVSATQVVSEFEVSVGAVPFLESVPLPFPNKGYGGGLPLTIEGSIVSTADIVGTTPGGGGWELLMDTVEIKGSNVPLLRQVLDSGLKLGSRDLGRVLEENLDGYTNPTPAFTTTFVDESLRVSRDQDGKLFVYAKVSDETAPKDYSGTPSDLGVGSLIEGLTSVFL